MDKKTLQTLIDDARASREPGAVIVTVDETHYQINEHPYELLKNYRDAFNRSELSDRFNTYFSRYDYLVGDWGFDQLRLRGFYDEKRNVPAELKISALQDYLDEACNVGCPYFVMKNEDVKVVAVKRPSRRRENRNSNRNKNQSRSNGNKKPNETTVTKQRDERPTTKPQSTRSGSSRRRSNHNKKRAYTVEHVKPVNETPVSERHGSVKTVGHKQHRKFTIREKKE